MRRACWNLLLFLTVAAYAASALAEASAPAAASAAAAARGAGAMPQDVSLSIWAPIGIIVVSYAFVFLLIARVAVTLERSPSWSLAEALSDEATITGPTQPPAAPVVAGHAPPGPAPAQPAPEMVTVLAGSTSRVIAFIGLIVIMAMFMGFGALIMLKFAACDTCNSDIGSAIESMVKYFLGGAALFVPYGFNQMKAGISSIFAK